MQSIASRTHVAGKSTSASSLPRRYRLAPASKRDGAVVRASKRKNPAPGPESVPEVVAEPEEPYTGPPILREFKSFGVKVIERSDKFERGPEDEEQDYWSDPKFNTLGEVMEKYFFPVVISLGILCGGIAAKFYNAEPDQYIVSPTSADKPAFIVDARDTPFQ